MTLEERWQGNEEADLTGQWARVGPDIKDQVDITSPLPSLDSLPKWAEE